MQPKQLIGSDTFHLELSEGMDYSFPFVYVDESTLLPVDLTGYRADLYVRSVPGSAQILKGITTSFSYNDGSIVLGSAGQITVNISGAFTAGVNWSSGVYDLVLTNPDQSRSKILRGIVNVYNTNTFPNEYSPYIPDTALILASGKTHLPNSVDLFGYMNPIKLGIGGGLLMTGSLRPAFYMDHEIAELSYTGGALRVTFVGDMPEGNVNSMKIGSQTFMASSSQGRVYTSSGAAGFGLTYWEWRDVYNPFGDIEGYAVAIQFEAVPGP
jgi:hypothetical protein